VEWPEEDLSSTADGGAGFYPLRLGEALDDERFVIIRKLGWGGYSTVWLAKDLKYVLDGGSSQQIADLCKQR
jgi:serine/threonine-protein kinase SRPK3